MCYFQIFTMAIAAAMLASGNVLAFDLDEKLPALESVERCDESDSLTKTCVIGSKLPIETLKSAVELRLFAFDLGNCDHYSRFDPDSEHLMPAKGVALDNPTREKIESMVPPAVWDEEASMCFQPHHALVWLDKRGNALATANVCFTCAAIEISFAGRAGRIQFDADFAELKQMFRNVGAPINLDEACSNPAHSAWKLETDQLCELKSLQEKARRLASPELRKSWDKPGFPGCVQLPGTIRF